MSRLYGIITNENGAQKRQGGNEELIIQLMHEKKGIRHTQSKSVELVLKLSWNDGTPILEAVEVPKEWTLGITGNYVGE